MRSAAIAKIVGTALVATSFPAPAAAQTSVRNFEGLGVTDVSACRDAKKKAEQFVSEMNSNSLRTADRMDLVTRMSVIGYSRCDCVDGGPPARQTRWTCTVDATLRTEKDPYGN